MVVVDHLKRIRYFTTRHCGSTHDARIFSESHLRANLERNFDNNNPRVLIGDEGFGCSRILLTPIRSDRIADEHQRNYNKAHKKARVVVEHSFGILVLKNINVSLSLILQQKSLELLTSCSPSKRCLSYL